MTKQAETPPDETPPIDVRVLFAAERTFLAWLRTGLAMMGFGFVVARFGLFLRELAAAHGEAMQLGHSRWLGILLVALGTAVVTGASRQHFLRVQRLHRAQPLTPGLTGLPISMSAVLILTGLLLTLYLLAAST